MADAVIISMSYWGVYPTVLGLTPNSNYLSHYCYSLLHGNGCIIIFWLRTILQSVHSLLNQLFWSLPSYCNEKSSKLLECIIGVLFSIGPNNKIHWTLDQPLWTVQYIPQMHLLWDIQQLFACVSKPLMSHDAHHDSGFCPEWSRFDEPPCESTMFSIITHLHFAAQLI